MATVRVELGARTQEERDAIMADLTDVMVKHGSPRESTQVILYEVSMDLWAKGGLSYTRRAAQATAS